MKKPKRLLAKTPEDRQHPRREETLVGHTDVVVDAAEAIMNVLEGSGIPQVVKRNWLGFQRLVLLGAAFHDVGKATNVFQAMLQPGWVDQSLWKKTHPVRHEILSALLLIQFDTPLKNWLQDVGEPADRFAWWVAWLAGGHHLRLHRETTGARTESQLLVRRQNTPREFIFYGDHPDVSRIIEKAASIAGCKTPEPLRDLRIPIDEKDDLTVEDLEVVVDDFVERCEDESKHVSEAEQILLATGKAVIVAADVAGSALSGTSQRVKDWIPRALNQVLSADELQKVIDNRLGRGGRLLGFQKRVASSRNTVTVVIAGCGNGKTVAAYAWAKKRACGRKLLFCYPTTGTASAGFEDYLLAQSDLERALIHGRSHVDIQRMLGTNEDGVLEENQRLESLKAWPQQVVVCTVDTVLGLIQNQRRGLFSYPAIATAAFVFDEIHNYDAKLFGALLRFLKAFSDSPVLVMSASIPKPRLRALRDALGDRVSDSINGEKELEEPPRYRLEWRGTAEDCWLEVMSTLRGKKDNKVLWVCNTVRDAITLYNAAIDKLPDVNPVLYHSQFRYKDRVARQERVLHEFERPGPSLVIATQVCEMSLDISADMMVTALPPFPALVQRLGRLNRHTRREAGKPAPPVCACLIYDFTCQENRPYRANDLETCKKTVGPLLRMPISQCDLAEALAALPQEDADRAYKYSAWLDGTWQTDQRPLRENGSSVTVLLERNLEEIKQQLRGRPPNCRNVAGWTIPVSFRPNVWLNEPFGGYPLMSDEFLAYDEETGARWKSKGET